MEFSEFGKILRGSWSRETSYTPDEWNESNPALGQCAVTALLVNDRFEGEIIWAEAKIPDGRKVSHYFNFINGEEIDLTRSQFPEGTIISRGAEKKKGFASTRAFMLSDSNTKRRYKILKERVKQWKHQVFT